jgi:hypothetical protein
MFDDRRKNKIYKYKEKGKKKKKENIWRMCIYFNYIIITTNLYESVLGILSIMNW